MGDLVEERFFHLLKNVSTIILQEEVFHMSSDQMDVYHIRTFDLLYLPDCLVIDLIPTPLVADHIKAAELIEP